MDQSFEVVRIEIGESCVRSRDEIRTRFMSWPVNTRWQIRQATISGSAAPYPVIRGAVKPADKLDQDEGGHPLQASGRCGVASTAVARAAINSRS